MIRLPPMMTNRVERLSDDVALYCGDCRDIMPTLGRVDAVVTDPPYGIGYQHGGGGTTTGLKSTNSCSTRLKTRDKKDKIVGDDTPFDPSFILQLDIPTILWGGNHFAQRLPTSGGWLIWDKSQNGKWKNVSFSHCELAWTNIRNTTRIHRQLWMGLIREGEENAKEVLHATQKPLALMRWCIEHLPPSSQTILDPLMGSGTTGVACVQLGRKFIGIEQEALYFDIACKRISDELRRPRLDLGKPVATPIQEALAL